jgi:hypothetical protein
VTGFASSIGVEYLISTRDVGTKQVLASEQAVQTATRRTNALLVESAAATGKRATAMVRSARRQAAAAAEANVAVSRSFTHTNRNLARSERGALAAGGAFRGLGRAMLFASNAFIGGAVIGFEIRRIIESTKALQVADTQLRTGVENLHLSWKRYGQGLRRFAGDQERLGFTQSEVEQGLARLVVSTKRVSKARIELTLAENIARARNLDLASAVQLVTKAHIGMIGGLRRQGIDVKKVTTAEDALEKKVRSLSSRQRSAYAQQIADERKRAIEIDKSATAQAALDALQRRYTRNAENYAKTGAGASDIFHASVEKLQIQLGRGLLPTMTPLIRRAAEWAKRMADSGQATHKMRQAVKGVEEVVHDLMPGLRLGIQLLRQMRNMLNLAAKAVGGWPNAFKIIISLYLANRFLKLAAAIRNSKIAVFALGQTAAATTGEVAGLRGALLGLGRLGAIAIPITLIVGLQTKTGRRWAGKAADSIMGALFGAPQSASTTGIYGAGIDRFLEKHMDEHHSHQWWVKQLERRGLSGIQAENLAPYPHGRRYYRTGARAGSGFYINPYTSFSVGRTDMGKDFGGAGDVRAIGRARITRVETNSGWPGGGLIVYELLDGPMAGRHVYVAEYIRPTVRRGQVVQKGAVIGYATGGGIETGWATASGQALSAARGTYYHGGDPGKYPTPEGRSFVRFLKTRGRASQVGLRVRKTTPVSYQPPSFPSVPGPARHDYRARAIRALNHQLKDTPMAGLGQRFYEAGRRYRIDPFLLAAIAGHETQFGATGTGRASQGFGAFGVGPGRRYRSYAEAIAAAAKLLAGPIYRGKKLAQIAAIWAPPGAANDPSGLNREWLKGVASIYDEIRGRVGTTFSSASPMTASVRAYIRERLRKAAEEARKARERLIARILAIPAKSEFRSELIGLGYEQFQLHQQLRNRFDTPGAGRARADYIKTHVLPGLRAEKHALERELHEARKHRLGEAKYREIRLAIEQKKLDIDNAKLARLEAIKKNTDVLKEFGGTTGFSFHDQTLTDLIAAGVGA